MICRNVCVTLLAAVLMVMSTAGLAAEKSPVLLNVQRLSLDTALRIAKAAVEECRKQGVQIAVTVVDRSGDVQVVLRDVLAVDLTLKVSRQKAYTAMSFNTPTSQLADRFDSPLSVAKVDGVLPAAGGLPITAAGALVGGVGVSGAPSGKIDEKCARAGLDSVRFDLEMAGM